MGKKVRNGLLAGGALAAAVILSQCTAPREQVLVNETTTIDSVIESGELVVLTLDGPTTYRSAADGAMGYEVDMIEAFAEQLGVEARFVTVSNIDALIQAIEQGRGHIGAAGLTITDVRAERVSFGPAYKNVEESVICHQDGPAPTTLDELAGTGLTVQAGSSYIETLERLKKDHGQLKWRARNVSSAMPILVSVAEGEIDCTVADSHIGEYARRLYPDLVIPMSLSADQPLGWIYNDKLAGMEGALPSVITGLVRNPVIAVPTSVGYGASLQGVTALLGMLSACATGMSVVNIDNGFGAGFAANQINALAND